MIKNKTQDDILDKVVIDRNIASPVYVARINDSTNTQKNKHKNKFKCSFLDFIFKIPPFSLITDVFNLISNICAVVSLLNIFFTAVIYKFTSETNQNVKLNVVLCILILILTAVNLLLQKFFKNIKPGIKISFLFLLIILNYYIAMNNWGVIIRIIFTWVQSIASAFWLYIKEFCEEVYELLADVYTKLCKYADSFFTKITEKAELLYTKVVDCVYTVYTKIAEFAVSVYDNILACLAVLNDKIKAISSACFGWIPW
ncbi:hypothetical protein COBT_001608 [Conglomerata obtusa]